MAYIPGAVRQVLIPKEGKPGATRPLGISNFEDKIVQKMMQKVLESIYEPLFHPNSYGFRPGRSCHDAIGELHAYLSTHEVETVIDVDLANYFGSISHQEAIKVIRNKISDPRLIRYLMRMFKSGVLTDGDLTVSDEGVVQGSCCSPVIANIFANEVICKWFDKTVKAHCAGEVKLVIYADDLVICCQYQKDALRIKSALGKRLQKYGLKMKKENDWARANRNKFSLSQLMKTAAAKVRGHVQYYGVSHNFNAVDSFVFKMVKILFKWLNRRSQRKSFNWEQFQEFLNRVNFPGAKKSKLE